MVLTYRSIELLYYTFIVFALETSISIGVSKISKNRKVYRFPVTVYRFPFLKIRKVYEFPVLKTKSVNKIILIHLQRSV